MPRESYMLRLGIRVFGERGATFQCSVYMLAVAGLRRQLEQLASQEPDRDADGAASAATTVRRRVGGPRAAADASAAPALLAPPRAQDTPAIKRALGARASFAFARRLLVPPRRVRWADSWFTVRRLQGLGRARRVRHGRGRGWDHDHHPPPVRARRPSAAPVFFVCALPPQSSVTTACADP